MFGELYIHGEHWDFLRGAWVLALRKEGFGRDGTLLDLRNWSGSGVGQSRPG